MSTPKPPLQLSPLAADTLRAAIAGRLRSNASNQRYYCLNPHSYVVARHEPHFWAALASCEVLLADGVGLVWGSRLIGLEPPPRVTGFDAFRLLCEEHEAAARRRVFFLGSNEEVLARMTERLAAEHPHLAVCGTYAPPFKPAFSDEEVRAFAGRVNAAECDLLLVGLTAPKQELLIERMIPHMRVRSVAAIGAVFDFYAGTKTRAPDWLVAAGAEWVYRLAREPRRLWRRTFVSGVAFARQLASGAFRREVTWPAPSR